MKDDLEGRKDKTGHFVFLGNEIAEPETENKCVSCVEIYVE